MTQLRVAVLDDHPSVRAGVRALLHATRDLEHLGEAGSEAELWPLLGEARPHVLLVDLHHPGRDGLALAAAHVAPRADLRRPRILRPRRRRIALIVRAAGRTTAP